MILDELLAIISNKTTALKVCADSRRVETGDIFVAVCGTRFDGHNFIEDAVKRGARYIVSQKPFKTDSAETILVDDTSIALGIIAQQSMGRPADRMTNLAVTGTNGKTTVTFLVRSVIAAAGRKCGLIGTVFNDTGGGREIRKSTMTTPDALSIAKFSAKMAEAGTEYMIIEASSHAIDQNRLAGINFSAAAFTNLSGEHLDYHKTRENYLTAKTRLFAGLDENAFAIINGDDAASKEIARHTTAQKLFYGLGSTADISASIESMDITGTLFTLSYNGRSAEVTTPLLGKYNISNHLAAAGLCIAAGLELTQIADGLSRLQRVPGRLEAVGFDGDFTVLIDYAHTDDAMKNVLSTLKPLCKGRLCVVFGCGGDRDKTKRPRMAKVAHAIADSIIITSDNPRTEEPEKIISDILTGLTANASTKVETIPDRRRAIETAIKNAEAGDIILIAGKGHEDYQIKGSEKIHFNDAETAGEFLR